MLGSAVASSSKVTASLVARCSSGHRSLFTSASSWPSRPSSSSGPRTTLTTSSTGHHVRSPHAALAPTRHQRRHATIIPEGVAILEKDPTYKPPVEIVEPPPEPAPSVIILYHTDKSTLSILCKNALVESSTARASIFERVRHEFPLEINVEIHESDRPSDEDWALIREIMMEQRANRSLAATPPAVLVPPENEDEDKSGIPTQFKSPMVVNLSTRKVCRGPLMYSQLEEMLTEMRNDQVYRLRLEDQWDAHLISQGKKPPRRARDVKHKDGLLWYEKFGILLAFWFSVEEAVAQRR